MNKFKYLISYFIHIFKLILSHKIYGGKLNE